MHPHQKTLATFYTAFAALDADAMAGWYAGAVEFRDEVFALHGKREAAGVWHMWCNGVKARARDDWKLVFSGVSADARTGKCRTIQRERP